MVDHAPRDLGEWMRSIERRLSSAQRAASSIPLSYTEKLQEDILADTVRHPAAPVELTYQTALYTEGGLARQYARISVDFPDVTKATDGSTIPIMQYELWGRDDTTNYLEASTSAVAGLAAPGITFPGLAATPAQKAAAAGALGPWTLLSTSPLSSLRHAGMIPGAVWTFKVRAIGEYTTAPGAWSQEFQTQLDIDTTEPPQPTAPELISARGTITVKWDGLSVNGAMPADFDHLIVAAGPSASPTTQVTLFYRGGGLTVLSDLEYYKTVFVRFRAVDQSGNLGPWSEQGTAYTAPLVDTDVILAEIDASQTLIRNIGSEALLDGVILESKLANNAITQAKLADNAISLAKLDTVVGDRIQKGLDDASAASSAALAADGKAGTAQTAADAARRIADAAIASGPSLIINGGFESDDIWATSSSQVYDTTEKRSGARSFKLTPTAGNVWPTNAWFDGATGRTYRCEFWIKRAGTTSTTQAVGAVFQSKTAAGGTSTPIGYPSPAIASLAISDTGYTKVTVDYTITTADTIQVRIAPWVKEAVGNTYWVDDVAAWDITDAKAALDAAKAAQDKADQAFIDAGEALAAAGLAQDAADGNVKVYYTPGEPSGTGHPVNSIWFRQSDNKVHLWDGDSWEPRVDAAIATAQQAAIDAGLAADTADGKAVTAKEAADAAKIVADQAVLDADAAAGEASAASGAAAAASSAAAAADGKAIAAQDAADAAIIDAAKALTSSAASYRRTGKDTAGIVTSSGLTPSPMLSVASDGAPGGFALQKTTTAGNNVYDRTAVQDFDPAALYRISFKVRHVTAATDGAKVLYAGIVGLQADGTTGVTATGASSWSSAHYFAASNTTVPADGVWRTYTGYFKGHADTGNGGLKPLPTAPGTMHAATRKIMPMALLDYPSGDGVWELGAIELNVVSAEGMQALADADAAQVAASAAQDDADAAALLAKDMVNISTSPAPATPAAASGAIWQQVSADGTLVIATWVAGASLVWTPRKLDDAMFDNINAVKITAGTINAARFNATDIRTKFLEAGKITAADIVAGTLTSASGVFGTMDASVINAGTLNAARLNATDIRTKFLAAGKITAADIVTGALTSASGVFGSVDANILSAGTLNAARIAAGSIAANKLVIGSTVNGLPDPSFSIPELLTARLSRSSGGTAGWAVGAPTAAGIRSVTHTTGTNNDSFHYAPTTPATGNAPMAIQCIAGQKWLFEVDVETDVSAGVRWNIYRYWADGTQTYSSLSPFSTAAGKRKLSYIWTVPAGCVAFELGLACNVLGAVWTVYGTGLAAMQSGATLIEDGAITTPKIVTGAILASHIKAGEITAGKLVAGTLTSASGVFGTMDASVINAGTLNAARLNAGDVRAKFIEAGKITAADMITGTITAASGIIGSLDIGKVTVGSLNGSFITANTLSTRHLKVGDFTNLVPDGGEAEDWLLGTTTQVAAPAGFQSAKVFFFSDPKVYSAVTQSAATAKKVSGGDKLRFAFRYQKQGNTTAASGAVSLRLLFEDAAGTLLQRLYLPSYTSEQLTPLLVSGVADVFAGSATVRVELVVSGATDTTVYPVYVGDLTLHLMEQGSLIVDGSLVGDKIDAQSVAAKVGQFIELDVSQLNASTADMGQAVIDKLWADVVRAKKITTDMLVVAGENLMPNGFGQNGDNTSWSGWGYDAADKPSEAFGSFTLNTQTTIYLANDVPGPKVEEDTFYVLEGWIKASVAGSRVYIEAMETGGVNPSPVYPLNSYAVPTVWTKFSVPVKTGLGNTNMGFRIFANHSAGTVFNATQKLAGIRYYKQNGASLVAAGGIATTHLATDSVTAGKIKALEIDSGHIKTNAIQTDKINAGAITATKLESTLILTSKIVAGPLLGTHAEMDPAGFKVYAEDLTDGIPNEVVRLGVAATNDYLTLTKSNGEPAATISDDGKISGMELHAKDALSYRGRELTDVLMDLPQGLVGYGDAYTGFTGISAEYGIFDVKVTLMPGRAYEITMYGSTSSTSATGGALHIVRAAYGGGAPVLASGEIKRFEHSYADTLPVPLGVTWLWYPQVAVPTVARLLWSVNKYGGGTAVWHAGEMSIKDVGRARLTVGTVNSGGGSTAAPVEVRQARWEANGFRNYQGSGAQYPLTTSYMYQGQSPAGYGNLKSIATFGGSPAVGNRTIAQELAGATVNWIRVYFNFQHWYYNSGGLAQIGVHNNSTVPASFSVSGAPLVGSGGWPKPGARWIDLPSSTFAGFKAGTVKGVYLEGIAGDYGTYGYANLPTIEINYTK